MIQSLLSSLIHAPRKLFLVDAIGELVSAFLLGIVLVHFQPFFGMPKSVLYCLAVLPLIFMGYDLVCYRIAKKKLALFLGGIAIANIGYCCISMFLVLQYASEITILGLLYFIAECCIILLLVSLQWYVIRKSTATP